MIPGPANLDEAIAISARRLIGCPDCKGARIHRAYACPGYRAMDVPCRTCSGSGVVTVDVAQRYAASQRMRQDRVERGVTLRREAEALGISPTELSKRERGEA